jgi:PHD/YefM family antitoxin component YafN of YafNO toxin-antitoxin module
MFILKSNIRELPITDARKNLTQIVENLAINEMVLLVKNYQPKAVLVNPEWFNQFPSLFQIRESIWGSHSQDIAEALEKLSNEPKELLPKLLRV